MAKRNTRRRAGGRAGNQERRSGELFPQMPWAPPINKDRPTEPLDQSGVDAIHDGAMRILEEVGIEFLNEEALALFKEAGCMVDGQNVRMGRDWVMEMVAQAPSSFTITPRNPDRVITIGEGHLNFGNVSSPPNYYDLEIGQKVSGTRDQCANLLKLTQHFNCIHFAGGYPVEPVDIHPSIRHLDVVYDKLTLTDKVMHAYSLGRERVLPRRGQAHLHGAPVAGNGHAQGQPILHQPVDNPRDIAVGNFQQPGNLAHLQAFGMA